MDIDYDTIQNDLDNRIGWYLLEGVLIFLGLSIIFGAWYLLDKIYCRNHQNASLNEEVQLEVNPVEMQHINPHRQDLILNRFGPFRGDLDTVSIDSGYSDPKTVIKEKFIFVRNHFRRLQQQQVE